MTFYENLDRIVKQDFGGRGLLAALPPIPLKPVADTLRQAERVVILTGFPVRLADGSFVGETDGPSGSANLAAALTQLGVQVFVVTDAPSFKLLEAALAFRAPEASLTLLPAEGTDAFIRNFVREVRPSHFISLERPGKAADGCCHNMRAEIIDDMVTDSSLFLSEAKQSGAVTISIGDGGNEMGMGAFRDEILHFVPHGETICAAESADYPLACGVSNWWGFGLAALLSHETETMLLPTLAQESELLRRVVAAGGVDGCTKERTLTVDHLPLEIHLGILGEVTRLVNAGLKEDRENFRLLKSLIISGSLRRGSEAAAAVL